MKETKIFLFIMLVCALVMFGFVQPTRAAVTAGVVGTGTPASCDEQSLRRALSGGGPVMFNCGGPATITVGEKIAIASDATVIGVVNSSGEKQITISGGLHTSIFDVQPNTALTLTNVVLTQALTILANGGAVINKGRLFIDNVMFGYNSIGPDYVGAAIFTTGPTEIMNSSFVNNDAGNGGAIFADTVGARVFITQSRFADNRGLNPNSGFGGALSVGAGAEVFVTDCGFSANLANFGGAMSVAQGGRLTVWGTNFLSGISDNTARGSGGGIYNEGELVVHGMSFRNNKTPTEGSLSNYGGGIASIGTLTITESFFRENESRFGGGVFAGGSLGEGRAVIERSAFSKNRAVVFGGGLYTNIATTTVTIDQSSFNGNGAGSGGGIARMNANVTISNTSLTNNTATNSGGGLFVGAVPNPDSGGYVKVRNVTISNNSSVNGLGGGVLNSARVELYHTTIVSNTQGVYSNNFGNTRFRGSVLQNPGYFNCGSDGPGNVSDDSRNFVTDTSCGLSSLSQQGTGLNPMLGPIAVDSFQPSWYLLPLPGSPLLHQATNCSLLDQRGAMRLAAPDTCDIGAVELGGLLPKMFLPQIVS